MRSIRSLARAAAPVALLVTSTAALAGTAGVVSAGPASAAGATLTRVSEKLGGGPSNGHSRLSAVTPDGRYVAFVSSASDLVAGDTNGTWDVFVRDTTSGATDLVSRSDDEAQGNGPSGYIDVLAGATGGVDISADGRYVAFLSFASNLVPNDTLGHVDIFVRDRLAGTTVRASVASDGTEANRESAHPSISDDGQRIAFDSAASNLVAGDVNGNRGVFVHDLGSGATSTVSPLTNSCGTGDGINPSISGDGRYVAFETSWPCYGTVPHPDNNFTQDIVVADTVGGGVRIGSTNANGDVGAFLATSWDGRLSEDGRYLVFRSQATLSPADTNGNVFDLYRKDLQSGVIQPVALDAAGAQVRTQLIVDPAISPDGQVVAWSTPDPYVTGDTNATYDVYARDLMSGVTSLVSVASDGTIANGRSYLSNLSRFGRQVTFTSDATNLVAGDGFPSDVYVRDLGPLGVCGGKAVTILGTSGPDLLTGTTGNDVIMGLEGDDTIDGLDGNDVVCGGKGDDTLVGGPGNDKLIGQAGNDVLTAGDGRDVVNGGAGTDQCDGGPGLHDKASGCEGLTGIP